MITINNVVWQQYLFIIMDIPFVTYSNELPNQLLKIHFARSLPKKYDNIIVW